MRDRLQTALLLIALPACAPPLTLHGIGAVKPDQLCADPKRCEVRGDKAVSTLRGRKARPIYLAEGQGPESFLGKVAPEGKAASVLKTCGGDVSAEDFHQTGLSARTLELTDAGKQQLRSTLKTQLAQELSPHAELVEAAGLHIDAAVDAASLGLNLSKLGFVSQTFWLKDGAFERRVGQCGEEEYESIIYSLTLLRLSDLTQKELESKLRGGLEGKLEAAAPAAAPEGATEAVPSPAEPPAGEGSAAAPVGQGDALEPTRALLREAASKAVRALASDLRVVTALGFDEQ